VGLAQGTVCYVKVTIPKGEETILRENVPDKSNTPNNCELDLSVQWHPTGADT